MARTSSVMDLNNLDSVPSSATFGQDASFRLEQPIGAMSISPSGRDVVLASKEGLHIIDLDSPYSPPRYLPHRTPWEVADVQWSPFAVRDYWIVSTSNQKALVWNVGVSGWRDAIEFVLHGHTRAITDINFSAQHPDVLATCAVDSFVHIWDLRNPARPAMSFSDWFAGATQVKFSRQDEHIVASSHDRFLHIWDKRKGAYPLRTIEAHGTKIYGIDWNRFEPTKIVTCSLDKTIKFWNTDNPDSVPERVIETPFPVWRARHTPFGWGLLAMPQRGSSNLHLYDRRPVDGVFTEGAVQPVEVFHGHRGIVREFLWRSQGTIKDGIDCRDFQLVSWGDDSELRLHRVDKTTFEAIGYEKGVSKPLRLNFTRKNARYRTFRDDFHEPNSPSEIPGRTDSNQSHQYSFSARGRQSTNIGMSKIPVAQFRGWLHGAKRERRTGMHGKSTVRQDMNPIAWMKNVKIASWHPDSLAEEISQVGERFSKLEFESLNIEQRKAVISFRGPWGENGTMTYIRADFRFPKAYPKDTAAVVSIYKTSSVDEDVHRTLSTEVHTIAETYASRQRGCMEAIVRYLLNEQTMEQIVSWLLGETVSGSKLVPSSEAPDDLSSDSDDDNLGGHADPSSSSANLRVPLAKGCGALWSNTGELVCFFPQKPKEPTSILSRFGAGTIGESQSNRLFEGFGRLQTSSPARKPGNGTQPTMDDSASDMSDVASTFSSDSSSASSSESDVGMRDRFIPYGNITSLEMRHRSRSPDRSNKSTTLEGTKIDEETRLNVVSVHRDLKHLLPAKSELAEQYKLFGPSADACEHNAQIAGDVGIQDVASAWRLASLILQKRVPLKISETHDPSPGSATLVTRSRSKRLHRKDSGIDLTFDARKEADFVGGVKWGNSPVGSKYLIAGVFSYFEKKGDIQTLALLSCILAQSHEHKVHSHAQGNPLPTTFRSSYQPSVEIVDAVLQAGDMSNNQFTLAITRPSATGKVEIAKGSSASQDFHPRRRNTSTVMFHPESVRFEDANSHHVNVTPDTSSASTTLARTNAVSASTSPEESRFSRRANSGVAFAASRASLNALAQTFQHSPPSNNSTAGSSLKKFSPSANVGWTGSLFGSNQNSRASRASQAPSEANSDEASNSNLRGSMSLVNLQDLRRDSRRLRGSHGSIKPSSTAGSGKSGTTEKTRKRNIKTILHNQTHFDIDGCAEVPLLDIDLSWKYRMYRMAYADQLSAWGLFRQHAELMQFDVENPGSSSGWQHATPKGPAPVPKLEITKCCFECGNRFAPVERNGVPIGWHCTSVSCHLANSKPSRNQICSICEQVVHGLSIPCLQCGHMTCYDCAQAWFGEASVGLTDTNDHDDAEAGGNNLPGHKPCPTGCGCVCPVLKIVDVPTPPSPLLHHESAKSSSLRLPSTLRQDSSLNSRPQRHKSEAQPGTDTAVGAMMALSRSRAASTTTTKTSAMAEHEVVEPHDNSNAMDELVPWASGKFTSLGRGIGGGLSRGLSNRSSEATIRKA